MSIDTQNAQILAHLEAGKTITALQAMDQYGCMRLSGRIYDLKQEGHAISKQMVKTASGKHVAEYWLDA